MQVETWATNRSRMGGTVRALIAAAEAVEPGEPINDQPNEKICSLYKG